MFGRGKKNTGGKNAATSDQVRKPANDLYGMPDLSAYAVPDNVGVSDEALEAELAALLEEGGEDERDAPKMQRNRRPAPPKQAKTGDALKQIEAMAAVAMKDVDDDEGDDDEDDDELLAELAGITAEAEEESASNRLVPAPQPAQPRTPSPGPAPKVDHRPAAAPSLQPETSSIKRSPSPARRPAPAPQSHGPAAPADMGSLLAQRAQHYQQVIVTAEAAGESARVRRLKRQLKTLQGLQRKVKLGKPIDNSEIPPEVFVPAKPEPDSTPVPATLPAAAPVPASRPEQSVTAHSTQPTPQESTHAPTHQPTSPPPEPAQPSPSKGTDGQQLSMLTMRRDQYKMAAVLAKRSGDVKTASDHLRISKMREIVQFDAVISAVQTGQDVDLSEMPGPPSHQAAPASSTAPAPAPAPAAAPVPTPRQPVAPAPAPSSQGAPPSSPGDQGYSTPKTDLEALVQRREKYRSMAEKAKQEQNDSKARRIGRIVKNYDDSIRKQKLGKPVDLSELASLPEFPPFPSLSGGGPPPVAASVPVGGALPSTRGAPPQGEGGQGGGGQATRPPPPVRQMSAKDSMYQRNIMVLKDRIAQYKKLALAAKRSGDIYEAKRLLKIAKEIEPMLSAAEGGLPVNMGSIPKLPQKKEEEQIVVSPPTSPEPEEGFEMVGGADAGEVYARLIATLQKQIEICTSNADVYGKLGNIKSVKRFQEFQDLCQQDLDLLVSKQSRGEAIPRHHYEQRTLPSVRVCPDVKESELEITVVQGVQLHCPNDKDAKDIDTYIKVEFPYPSDEPQCHKTGWAKGAEQPQYNSTCTVDINRNSRAFNSAMKRKAIKMEVIYSKGLLRGHKTLGTANLKLAELETKCELHESVPLLEGRREIGGRIEVKVRIHHPLAGLKEDFIKEKWLIVDSVHKKTKISSPTGATAAKKTSPSTSSSSSSSSQRSSATDSIEVLKWEIGTLKKKIAELQAHKQQVPSEFVTSYTALQERLQKLQTYIKEGGSKARQAYVSRLQALSPNLLAQAKEAVQTGQKDKATMIMTRKKLVDTEITALRR